MAKTELELLSRAEEIMECNGKTVTLFGRMSALSQLSVLVQEIVDRKGEAAVLICGGGHSFHESGVRNAVINSLGQLDADMSFYEGIPPEPGTGDVRKIAAAIQEHDPDFVVAAGGGSVLDAAKAAYLSVQTGMDVSELFGSNKASEKFPGKHFEKIIAIPTTSGTGSESTPYSNIIETESGIKRLISDPAIIPSYAFADPVFTNTLSPEITVTTALDAMVHAIESLLNFKAGEKFPENQERACLAVEMIVRGLPLVLDSSRDAVGRELLSAAAVLGGICIRDCPTSLPHLCSFSLCGKTTHGRAVAALLTHFWRYYLAEKRVREKTMLLAGVFPGRTPEDVVDSCEQFIRSTGAETDLGKLTGLPDSFIEQLAVNAAANPMKLESAPRPVKAEDCSAVFHAALDPAWKGGAL